MNIKQMQELGWDRPDFCIVSGDAYVDHPSFGTAIISRVLQKHGYKVAVIAQPDWKTLDDFKQFGRPRLGFLVNSGNMDSMVNHYTTAKKPRSQDAYTPGGKTGKRPDRAVIVYCNCIRKAFSSMPIIIGGIEASLRRFAHYDYWDDRVRRSILIDSGANLLIYGMGERCVVEVANLMNEKTHINNITNVPGTAYVLENINQIENLNNFDQVASFDEVSQNKKQYAKAFIVQGDQMCSTRSKPIIQQQTKSACVVVNPPQMPLSTKELDEVYALPYQKKPHPSYTSHISAIDEVEFSLVSNRGCFGSCSFCALNFHQGRIVTARSNKSIVDEATSMTKNENFKGYIHDVGGPTANFSHAACQKQEKGEVCKNKQCLFPEKCSTLDSDHQKYSKLLKTLRNVRGVKKVFVRSGLRYDYILYDYKNKDRQEEAFFPDFVEHHVSGQLKVAPEHINERVLELMGKPKKEIYERFVDLFNSTTEKVGKEQYIVPYFMSSHPGSDMHAAIELAQYMKKNNIRPEQVQDFYPTPGTLSTTMFYTGIDPRNGREVYVPKDPKEKQLQRALLQSYKKENAHLVVKALEFAQREDLIGNSKDCLVSPQEVSASYILQRQQQKTSSPQTNKPRQTSQKRESFPKSFSKKAAPASAPQASPYSRPKKQKTRMKKHK